MQLLKENVGEDLADPGYGDEFFNKPLKASSMHEKNNKIDKFLVKLKTSVLQETKSVSFLVMGGARFSVSYFFYISAHTDHKTLITVIW